MMNWKKNIIMNQNNYSNNNNKNNRKNRKNNLILIKHLIKMISKLIINRINRQIIMRIRMNKNKVMIVLLERLY